MRFNAAIYVEIVGEANGLPPTQYQEISIKHREIPAKYPEIFLDKFPIS